MNKKMSQQNELSRFKKETGITLEIKNGKPHLDGYLDLSNTGITQLPKGLTVSGSLYLSNTGITQLPKDLTVGCSLLSSLATDGLI